MLSTLADCFAEQKRTLALFSPSYCELCNPYYFKGCLANDSLDSIEWANYTS